MERKTITLSLNLKRFLPNLLWVLKARSTDKNRHILQYLNIDDRGYCCTDGRRLHLCKDKTGLPAGLENGLYEVIVAKDLIVFQPADGEFPDYKNILPVGLESKFGLNMEKVDNADLSIVLGKILLKTGALVNIDYLKDMAGYSWDIARNTKERDPVQFIDRDLLAIIMPINLNID